MTIKRRTNDLEELNSLSDEDRERILKEYKKGYHFLLFYGKLIVFFLMAVTGHYMVPAIKELNWAYRTIIYLSAGYFIFYAIKIIEINIVAKKVLHDLIRDMIHQRGKIKS